VTKRSVAMTGLVLGSVMMANMMTFAAPPDKTGAASGKSIARGEYLVKRVAMCGDCHSPRNEKGEYIEEKWMQGQVLPFKALVPIPWADRSPNLAGLKGLTDDKAVRLLMGERVLKLRAPMPEYALSKEDATAVVAYLRSLAPAAAAAKPAAKK
jgi:mono/diheme cytochrome c family protein